MDTNKIFSKCKTQSHNSRNSPLKLFPAVWSVVTLVNDMGLIYLAWTKPKELHCTPQDAQHDAKGQVICSDILRICIQSNKQKVVIKNTTRQHEYSCRLILSLVPEVLAIWLAVRMCTW